jgi:serine protease Do
MKSKLIAIASVFGIAGLIVGLIISSNLDTNAKSYAASDSPKYALQEPSEELQGLENLSKAFVAVSKKVTPSVVTINSEQVVERPTGGFFDSPFEDFFDRFFQFPEDQQREIVRPVLGSGVIATTDGYIITNNHVVEKAKKIYVTLSDGQRMKAKIVGTDPLTDVAVVKVDENSLPAAVLGDSDKLEVGEWVLAIGNPFSEILKHTVTAGIVSATGRSNLALPTRFQDFIQTDAAINPGNSGGALVNLRGQVIGINTLIVSGSGGYQGIGFAIPINMVRMVMDSIITKGRVIRGWLGVQITAVDEKMAKALGLEKAEGILITKVDEDSPAEKAGLQREDIILEFQGKKPESLSALQMMVAATEPGTEVELLILRKGKEKVIKMKLGELKTGQAQEQKEEKVESKLGLQVRTLTPSLARRLGYEGEKGVVVVNVQRGSLAYDAGLRARDLIIEVNRQPVENTDDYYSIVDKVKKGDTILLVIKRDGGVFYILIEIPEED